MAQKDGIEWMQTIDFAGYKRLMAAEREHYSRRRNLLVLFCLILIWAWLVLLAIQSGPVILVGLWSVVLFAACATALCIWSHLHPGERPMRRKSYRVQQWFKLHGAAEGELSCTYAIKLMKHGFIETSKTTAIRVPWLAMDGRIVHKPEGLYFCCEPDLPSSILWRSIKKEGRWRETTTEDVLFVPKSALDAHPGLEEKIMARIETERPYRNMKEEAVKAQSRASLDWMMESSAPQKRIGA